MPFPFTIPTTSRTSFSSTFNCDTHPSLPLNAGTQRGVVRDTLKKHKRLPPSAQAGNLNNVVGVLKSYIPFLLALDAGVNNKSLPDGHIIHIGVKSPLKVEWRPTLAGDVVPGRDRSRVKINSLEHEVCFIFHALASSYVLLARAALQPLYVTAGDFIEAEQRRTAIVAAAKHLTEAASIYNYLASRAEKGVINPPCVDVASTTLRALASLAHAEATILSVFKDDPYPAAVAQDRNKNDKEWMFKSPEIPKVRAHLFARLCLAASEHAAKAASSAQSTGASNGSGRMDPGFTKYIENLRQTSRARACRFLGIDADLAGQTADGIGWLRAGLYELGIEAGDEKKGFGLGRLKKEFSGRREDKRVEKETAWGADAGRLEETRVLEMLSEKWNKVNDTVSIHLVLISQVTDKHGLDEHQSHPSHQRTARQDTIRTRY